MSKKENEDRRVRLYRWEEMPWERVSPVLDRRMITGDRVMVTQLRLKRGCIVPLHAHEHEQISYILEGVLRFWIGSEAGEEILVRSGEVLHLPSYLPHGAEALEDTLAMDMFSPPRQDWIDGTDDYLRTKGPADPTY